MRKDALKDVAKCVLVSAVVCGVCAAIFPAEFFVFPAMAILTYIYA